MDAQVYDTIKQAREIYPEEIAKLNHQSTQQVKTKAEQPVHSEKPKKQDDGPGFGSYVLFFLALWVWSKFREREEHIQDGMSSDARRRINYEMWLHDKK